MFSNSVVIVNVNDVASDFDIRLVFFWSNSSCVCASVLDWLQSISSVWLFKFKFIKSLHNYLRKSSLPKIIIRMVFFRRIPLLNCCTSTWWRRTARPTCPPPWPPRLAHRPPPHPTTRIPTGCALTRRWCAPLDAAIGNSSNSCWVCRLQGVVLDSGSGLSARASFTGDAECHRNLMQTVIFCWHNFWRRPPCFYFIDLPYGILLLVLVLGILDILAQIQIRDLTNGSGPGSNFGFDSFLQWLKGWKKIIFFLRTYTQAYYLQSYEFNFLLKFFAKKIKFASNISVRSTPLWEKGRIRILSSD